MQTLHISRQELHTRGGVLDRMLDSLFDTAILVDTDCRILYISASSFPDPSQRAAVVGQHISVLDQLSPFEEVLRTGQPRPDLFLELHGRPCISSLFPVLDGERVIGVVGTITVRNLGRLKKVLSQLSDQAAGFRGLYQDLARVDSGYRLEDFVGESPRVADLLDKARKAAHSGESVLILGETGTGKENSSATRRGLSPAPPRPGWASFNWRGTGISCWTRSGTWICRCSPSCCGCWSPGSLSGWAVVRSSPCVRGSSPRPTKTCWP